MIECDWQTANILTDYEIVKCKYPATHITQEGEVYCLPHADLYRTIMGVTPDKITTEDSE